MTTINAEICLYGNRETGAGWLARLSDGTLLGDGETRVSRSFTGAVMLACDAIRDRDPGARHARLYDAGGRRMATIDIRSPGWYGTQSWEPATVVEISAAAIEAAATR